VGWQGMGKAWFTGQPAARGGWGCLSPHWLQGEPRHRAKPRCVFYPRRKVGKAYGEDVRACGVLLTPLGTAGAKLPDPQDFFGVKLAAQHHSPPGDVSIVADVFISLPLLEQVTWRSVRPSRPSLSPLCPAARSSPSRQEDVLVPDSCCVRVFSSEAGSLVAVRGPEVTRGVAR